MQIFRAAFALAGILMTSSVSIHAEDVPSDRADLRKAIEKEQSLRSRQDTTPPAVTHKGEAVQAEAYDGETVIVGPVMYRLWGIAAPRVDEFGGYSSMQGLVTLIGEASVVCTPTGLVVDDVAVARCKADGRDLSAAMVAQGWARDCPRQSGGTYAQLEQQNVLEVADGFELPSECQTDF